MPTEDFKTLTAQLRSLGGQHVWSLMISLFGDLAQEEGQMIEGPLLTAIMQGLDVKPEAARVALHRLRKDGWLASSKTGRIGRHSLTAVGRAQSAAASPRIYADPSKVETEWQLIMLPDMSVETEGTLAQDGFAEVAPRTYVGPLNATPPQGALALAGQEAPDWLIARVQPGDLAESYDALLQSLNALQDALPDSDALSPLHIAILRCLIVHNWRRLVLKHPILPTGLVDPSWAGHQCHLAVWDLLGRFPRPALVDLEKHLSAA